MNVLARHEPSKLTFNINGNYNVQSVVWTFVWGIEGLYSFFSLKIPFVGISVGFQFSLENDPVPVSPLCLLIV